jgi:archaellum component FlaC
MNDQLKNTCLKLGLEKRLDNNIKRVEFKFNEFQNSENGVMASDLNFLEGFIKAINEENEEIKKELAVISTFNKLGDSNFTIDDIPF